MPAPILINVPGITTDSPTQSADDFDLHQLTFTPGCGAPSETLDYQKYAIRDKTISSFYREQLNYDDLEFVTFDNQTFEGGAETYETILEYWSVLNKTVGTTTTKKQGKARTISSVRSKSDVLYWDGANYVMGSKEITIQSRGFDKNAESTLPIPVTRYPIEDDKKSNFVFGPNSQHLIGSIETNYSHNHSIVYEWPVPRIKSYLEMNSVVDSCTTSTGSTPPETFFYTSDVIDYRRLQSIIDPTKAVTNLTAYPTILSRSKPFTRGSGMARVTVIDKFKFAYRHDLIDGDFKVYFWK